MEHYDIRSVNPSTGEVRLIEVKGHKGLEIYAELTEDEAELAVRERAVLAIHSLRHRKRAAEGA